MASKPQMTEISTSEYDELTALKAKVAARRSRSAARRSAKATAMKTPEAIKAYKQALTRLGFATE